jgi:serine/threonine protein kinase
MPEEQTTLTTLPVGSLVRGRYQIRRVLASGSAGTVYLVKDQQTKNIKYQLFALKEIVGLDQQARYHLTVGSMTLRQLRHSALPAVHTIFNDDKRGCVYVVMDYVEGVSLEALCLQQPRKRLNWAELRGPCEQVAGALTYLHLQENPLCHGDLKPSSIVRNNTGRMMLLGLDYTQSARPEQLPRVFTRSSYRAPEQFTGQTDALSDVYGLGAVLYELLTGQKPADAITRLERVNKRKSDPLALASKIAPGVSRPLAETLQKALALNPAERFQSIKEFWQALSVAPVLEEEAAPLVLRQKTPAAITSTPINAASTQSSDATPAIRSAPIERLRRSLLPIVAILCALILLLAGLGALAVTHFQAPRTGRSGQNTPSGQPTTSITGTSTRTSPPNQYTNIMGTYQGRLFFIGGTYTTFTLFITHQTGGQFTGNFTSPLSSLQSGTVVGTIDTAKNPDINMTLLDSSQNALLYLSGGLNGIIDSRINTNDSAAGTFFTCKPRSGPNCIHGGSTGGSWSLEFESSALLTKLFPWS